MEFGQEDAPALRSIARVLGPWLPKGGGNDALGRILDQTLPSGFGTGQRSREEVDQETRDVYQLRKKGCVYHEALARLCVLCGSPIHSDGERTFTPEERRQNVLLQYCECKTCGRKFHNSCARGSDKEWATTTSTSRRRNIWEEYCAPLYREEEQQQQQKNSLWPLRTLIQCPTCHQERDFFSLYVRKHCWQRRIRATANRLHPLYDPAHMRLDNERHGVVLLRRNLDNIDTEQRFDFYRFRKRFGTEHNFFRDSNLEGLYRQIWSFDIEQDVNLQFGIHEDKKQLGKRRRLMAGHFARPSETTRFDEKVDEVMNHLEDLKRVQQFMHCRVLYEGVPLPEDEETGDAMLGDDAMCACYIYVLVPEFVDLAQIPRFHGIYFTSMRWYYACYNARLNEFREISYPDYVRFVPSNLRFSRLRDNNSFVTVRTSLLAADPEQPVTLDNGTSPFRAYKRPSRSKKKKLGQIAQQQQKRGQRPLSYYPSLPESLDRRPFVVGRIEEVTKNQFLTSDAAKLVESQTRALLSPSSSSSSSLLRPSIERMQSFRERCEAVARLFYSTTTTDAHYPRVRLSIPDHPLESPLVDTTVLEPATARYSSSLFGDTRTPDEDPDELERIREAAAILLSSSSATAQQQATWKDYVALPIYPLLLYRVRKAVEDRKPLAVLKRERLCQEIEDFASEACETEERVTRTLLRGSEKNS
jgi:hypothetical protein